MRVLTKGSVPTTTPQQQQNRLWGSIWPSRDGKWLFWVKLYALALACLSMILREALHLLELFWLALLIPGARTVAQWLSPPQISGQGPVKGGQWSPKNWSATNPCSCPGLEQHRYLLPQSSSDIVFLPWLVWISGMGIILQTRRSMVPFPVRVRAWVSGLVPGWGGVRGNRSMFLSHIHVSFPLSFSPFPSLW